jgi:DoxX-like family
MPADAQTAPRSKMAIWTGRVITALAALLLLMDGVIHITKPAPVVTAFARLGFPLSLAVDLAIIELFCLALYVIPPTAILGAILLTGYLGGAVAINMRAGDPFFETIFPALFGVLVWAGIYFRDARLRALIPFKN